MNRFYRELFLLLIAPSAFGACAFEGDDPSNAPLSDDSSGADTSADTADAPGGDTASSEDSDVAPWDSDSQSCGNGVVEPSEVCEIGNSSSCTELSSRFASGLAYCEAGCGAWNTAQCVCASGFEKIEDICKDVDECAEDPFLCHENASCTNKLGGFECSCLDGFHGDGFSCAPIGDISAGAWIDGALPADGIVSGPQLHPLPGEAAGPPIYVSNNPEAFHDSGWLMQSSRTDDFRGGFPHALEGSFPLYLFHTNRSGGTKYLHVLVTNPGPAPLSVSAIGSVLTNSQYPCSPNEGQPGQSYRVAEDWITQNYDVAEHITALPEQQPAEIVRVRVDDADMVDGRLEIDATEPLFVYVVATSTGDFSDAVEKSQGPPAKGEILEPGPNAYGRQAGIYEHSLWQADFHVALPDSPSHIAFPVNTSSKFEFGGAILQDQTAPAVVQLDDSSKRSYGNYGWKYDIALTLTNESDAPKTVTMWFAHHLRNSMDQPGFTFNGPIAVDGEIHSVLTTPTRPKFRFETWILEPQKSKRVPIEFYVPGLIIGGSQLILESY